MNTNRWNQDPGVSGVADGRALRWLALAAATAILFLGAVPATQAKDDSGRGPAPKLNIDTKPLDREGPLPRSFAPVVKKSSASVAQVFTSTRPRMNNVPFQDPFEFFFGPQNPRRGAPSPAPRQTGAGSAVVVSKDGYLLTNNHVVDGADEVKAKLPDGRELNAKVVGGDEKSDIAVLKVNASDLEPVTFADSDKIEVGDIVFAVGNPFGIGQTVTMGIVSATGRTTFGSPLEDFIQTDAAINPGNSGGALVDAAGRLVGINAAIISRSGGNQGIGFAIPANMARDVLEALVTEGKVTRGYLGVLPQDITPSLAKKLELKNGGGALLAEVTPRGPADKAGLESGDVVLEFNGKPIRDAHHLRLEVARTKPADAIPVRIRRDGETKTLKVSLRERPEDRELMGGQPGRPEPRRDEGTLNGVGVADINPQYRQQYNLPPRLKGVLVTEVEEGSPAWDAGLRPGNVILELNREPVSSADQAVKLTEDPKDKTTLLKLWTPNGTRFLVVDESESK